MGSKTEVKNQTAPRTKEQKEWDQYMLSLARKAGDALDIESMAGDDPLEITDAMKSLVNRAVGGQADIQRRQVDADYEDQERQLRALLAKRGQTDSSNEVVEQAVLGRDRVRSLANIESQRSSTVSNALLNLPFQNAALTHNRNSDLLSILTGTAHPVMNAGLQTRLANSTQTQETSGLGTMAPFMSAYSG